jgi:outer membrane lipoprotein
MTRAAAERQGRSGARWLLPALALSLAVGCASGSPGLRDAPGIAGDMSPATLTESDLGARVVWGGRVLDNQPLADGSLLQVIAYPLDRHERPQLRSETDGRFLARASRFLEPTDYAPGRLVTLRGALIEQQLTRIGEHERLLPVIDADAVHLWPERPERSAPRLHFGVGVSISR